MTTMTMEKLLSPLNEKDFKNDLLKISNIINNNPSDLLVVEKILYDNKLLKNLNKGYLLRVNHFCSLLESFILDIRVNENVELLLCRFYSDNIFDRIHTEQYIEVDKKVMSMVKELVWLNYYLSNKKVLSTRLCYNSDDLLKLILNIDDEYLEKIGIDINVVFNNFMINVLSLKNGKYDLLPHPYCCDMNDLHEIIVLNSNDDSSELLNMVKSTLNNNQNRIDHCDYLVSSVRVLLEN